MTSAADRRETIRDLACFPADIAMVEAGGSALVRDVSVKGASLLTQARLAEGERVSLSLYIFDDRDRARAVTGRVVRVERVPAETGLWPRRVAVEFDESLADCEAEMMAWAERNADVYGQAI
jgi:PilZ domain